jgi:GNAT superfamily N-acetyltransferase
VVTATRFTITAFDADGLLGLVDLLQPLYRECFTPAPWHETREDIAAFPEAVARQAAHPGAYGFVASQGGQIAGASYGWPAPAVLPQERDFDVAIREAVTPEVASLLVAPAVIVSELMVAPGHRGQGLGRALLARQVVGHPRAWLVTHPEAEAVSLYESSGWVRRAAIDGGAPRVLYTREAVPARHAVPGNARLFSSAPPDRRPRRRSF